MAKFTIWPSDVRVCLRNIDGDAHIEVWDRAEIWVRATKIASSQELFVALEIKINANPSSVLIDTRYPKQGLLFGVKGHTQVDYTQTI